MHLSLPFIAARLYGFGSKAKHVLVCPWGRDSPVYHRTRDPASVVAQLPTSFSKRSVSKTGHSIVLIPAENPRCGGLSWLPLG